MATLAFLRAARKQHGRFAVGYEATGNMWEKLCSACIKEGIEFSLGSPFKVKVVWMTSNKNYKKDAETIADLLRRNALPACHVGDEEARVLRDTMHSNITLVHDRTRICNRLTSGHGF